jgi:hypothetical protein
MNRSLLICFVLYGYVVAFIPRQSRLTRSWAVGRSTTTDDNDIVETTTAAAVVDPKEMVKIFGRLAEKYIALDSSAGQCCYSACSDCEYRLPGGGYRMAESTAARPKWIPVYERRNSNGREHVTKWSSEIFRDSTAVDIDEFVERLVGMEYIPPLGGPYVGASTATVDDTSVAKLLFQKLAGSKTKLTKHRMSQQLQFLGDGSEGLTWASFQKALETP